MTAERYKQICEIVAKVIGLSESDRLSRLHELINNDADLQLEVEKMLKADQQHADNPLTAFNDRPNTKGVVENLSGLVVGGRYKLSEKLGEGGMGTVWKAEQIEPIKRDVAIKLIRSMEDSQKVIARFEIERQALAVMDHSNIAKVLDAGTTDDGRPYFVMELVVGKTITAHCDEMMLSTQERLELFLPVCHAVQHAHHKGIIHRDIKPGNVLVTVIDGKPVPKVIDFGIAKAIDQKKPLEANLTRVGSILGTPEYMAPEQAELRNHDVDTRADIFSLGVILYELLTGSTPFTHEEFKSAALFEILRIVREVEPPKPSTKLSRSTEIAGISAKRRVEPRRLKSLIEGELDWIVMKCLEKSPDRRYGSADGLRQDLQRYLSNEVVLAGPPSAAYRVRKFVLRNRTLVGAIFGIAASIIFGIVTLLWGYSRVITERNEKEQAFESERKHRLEAVAEREKAKRLSEVATKEKQKQSQMLDYLRTSFPALNDQSKYAKERADLDGWLQDDHLSGQMTFIVGNIYRSMGRWESASKHYQTASLSYLKANDRMQYLQSKHASLLLLAENDYSKSVGVELSKLAGESQGTLGRDSPITQSLLMAEAKYHQVTLGLSKEEAFITDHLNYALTNLKTEPDIVAGWTELSTDLLVRTNRVQQAMQEYENWIHSLVSQKWSASPLTLRVRRDYARLLQSQRKHDKAKDQLELIVKDLSRLISEDHPDSIDATQRLAWACYVTGDWNRSILLYRKSLALSERTNGKFHPSTAWIHQSLGWPLLRGNKVEAMKHFKQAIEIMKEAAGELHPETLQMKNSLGRAHYECREYLSAIEILQAVSKQREQTLGPMHNETLDSLFQAGQALYANGQFKESLPLLRRAKRGFDALAESNVAYRNMLYPHYLGLACYFLGDYEDALAMLTETLSMIGKPPNNEKNRELHLADLYHYASLSAFNLKKYDLARQFIQTALSHPKLDQDDVLVFSMKSIQGQLEALDMHDAEAERLLIAGYEGIEKQAATIWVHDRSVAIQAHQRLVAFFKSRGKVDDAKRWEARRIQFP